MKKSTLSEVSPAQSADSQIAAAKSAANNQRPEFVRLPRSGTLCRHSALSRSKMNELVLPSKLNGFNPPVRSISLRNRGQVKAVRLVVLDSLLEYVRSFETAGKEAA